MKKASLARPLLLVLPLALVFAGEAASVSRPRARANIYETHGRDLGTRLRGDWEPPGVLLVAFSDSWAESLADLIAVAAAQTQVVLLVDPATTPAEQVDDWAQDFNVDLGALRVLHVALDTPWIRDYGPFEVRQANGGRVWLDADYAPSRPQDDAVPEALAAAFGVERHELPFALQGGAIISNGWGLCAATREYGQAYGLDVDDPAIMDPLLDELGCRVLAWLPALRDDLTHHADMFAQFLAPDVVAVAEVEASESAEDAARMDEAARILDEAARRMGVRLHLVRIPVPSFGDGRYRTYVNGVRLPTALVVPSYADVPDAVEAKAYRRLAEALPGVDVVAVPADDIIQLRGSLHCITLGLGSPG